MIYVEVPYRLSIHWTFAQAFEKIVPITADETTTNYNYAVVTYSNMLTSTSYKCSGPFSLTGDAAPVVGKLSLTIDSAKADGTNDIGATEYVIHGSMHAVCPGAGATKGNVTLDATF